VDNVQIVKSCGFPELEQAAIRAVKQARFEPARRGNSKVPAPARITLTFQLKH
jgi:TonB family protein